MKHWMLNVAAVCQIEYMPFWNQTLPHINEAVMDVRHVFCLNEYMKEYYNSVSVDKNESQKQQNMDC